MVSVDFDVIVVGGGIMGSSCAYKLTQRLPHGKVLLLEQFDLLHDLGSSHGSSRICRYSYDDPVYARMGIESIRQWRDIEKSAGTQVYYQKGGLDFGPEDDINLNKVIQVAKEIGFEIQELSREDLVRKYPVMSGVPKNYKGCYQENAGIINASKAVDMFQKLFLQSKKVGAEIRANEKLVTIEEKQDHIVVTTDKGIYTTKKVVLTCGAWVKDIVEKNFAIKLKLVPKRVSYYLWKIKEQYHKQFVDMPVFIHWGDDPYNPDEDVKELGYYGFGIFDKPGYIKVGVHDVFEEEKAIDIHQRATDKRDGREVAVPRRKVELTRTFVQNLYEPCIENETYSDMLKNGHIVTCLYTCTPSEDFVLDKIPGSDNIILGSPCSGHGFKFGPVIGEMLAELVTETSKRSDLFMNQFPRSKFSIQHIIDSSHLRSCL